MDGFLQFFSGIRWQDVVDISLNSYIAFRLYVLFRGTTAFKMLIGIAFLWMFQKFAAYSGLIISTRAIQGTIVVAILIIIVIFSEDIRQVFQSRSFKSILWGFERKTVQAPIDVIVDSIYEMSRMRTGALIILPGSESLKDIIHNGIDWDGVLSREMLMSVFWHDNPVHDGAVVIKGNRISKVSVILPLSHEKQLPSYYGTRHRAALGLAEVRDALVIVVSEERGEVSAAKNSKILLIPDKLTLEAVLRDHMGVKDKARQKKGREKSALSLGAMLSVLFVMIVWYGTTRGFINTLITFEAPIEFVNRDPGMDIMETSVNKVRLHLSGSDVLVKSLRPQDVRVRIDMNQAVDGSNVFTLTRENVSLPPGIILTKVEPYVVEMKVDAPMKKQLPIQVDWVGKLDPGLILTDAKVEPSTVNLTGNGHLLRNISTVYTEKVILDTIKKSGQINVKPSVNRGLFTMTPELKDGITVTYTVKERRVPEPAPKS